MSLEVSAGAPATTSATGAALAPAKSPPVVKECSQRLTYSMNGNALPLTCSSGGLNVLAWRSYTAVGTAVMSLGPGVNATQVVNAMCVDMAVDHATLPEAKSAATLAAAYYGWDLSILSKVNAFFGPCE